MKFPYREMYRQMRIYPSYLWYLFGVFLSGLGDLSAKVALIWYLATSTPQPLVHLSILMMGMGAVFPAMLTVGGYWVDRYGYLIVARRAVIAQILLWTGFVALWMVFKMSRLTFGGDWVVGILVGDAALAPLLRPVDSALTQNVILSGHRESANALRGMQYELTYLLAPLLGGLLAAQHALLIALGFNILSFIVLEWVFFRMSTDCDSRTFQKTIKRVDVKSSLHEFAASVLSGARLLWGFKSLAGLVFLGFWWNMWILGPVEVLFPLLAHGLKGSAVSYGGFLMANSLGFLGGLLFWARKHVPRPWGWRYAGVLILDGVVYTTLGLVHSVGIAWFLVAAGGFITAPTDIWGSTLRQELIHSEYQGRVSALAGLVGFTGAPLGTVWVLLAINTFHWTIPLCFLIFGCILTAGALVISLLPVMRTA